MGTLSSKMVVKLDWMQVHMEFTSVEFLWVFKKRVLKFLVSVFI